MKATIDSSGCIGCGLCADICPEVFHMTDDGVATADGTIAPENEGCAKEAAENCPVSVIAIEEN